MWGSILQRSEVGTPPRVPPRICPALYKMLWSVSMTHTICCGIAQNRDLTALFFSGMLLVGLYFCFIFFDFGVHFYRFGTGDARARVRRGRDFRSEVNTLLGVFLSFLIYMPSFIFWDWWFKNRDLQVFTFVP